MHWAYWSAKKDNLNHLKWSTLMTTVLGISFLVGQFLSWGDLVDQRVFFGGSTSNAHGSILYVLSGLHGLHVIGGVIFLVVVLFNSFTFKIHSKNMVQIEMCMTYWHFLGALWVYLFVFLLLNH
jgi:cytochrome c oxidase subunit 3